MEYVLHLLESHGYGVIFLVVMIDFLGVPIASIPLLVIGGALAASGKLSLGLIAPLAALAASVGDTLWYSLGRARGQMVLGTLCKLSHNQEICVERGIHFVTKFGAASLILSKFLPGIATFAPPAAGTAGMPLLRFLVLDFAGSFLWASAFSSIGYLFSKQVHAWFELLRPSGHWNLIVVVMLAGLVFFLYLKKKPLFLKKLMRTGGIET